MRSSPDFTPVCSPDSLGLIGDSLDSVKSLAIRIGAAADFFCAAKAAEGSSPRTVEWYRMILVRAVRRFGARRPVDAIPAAELRAWPSSSEATLSPESIAGYVRGLKAFGNWCATEELAAAAGFRALRRPKVPRRLIAPFSDPELRSLLALASSASARSRSSSSTPGSGCPSSPRCGSATCARTGRSTSWVRAPRSASCRSARRPGGRSSAISRPAMQSRRATRSSAAAGVRVSPPAGSSSRSHGSGGGRPSGRAAARTRSAIRSPAAISSMAATCLASSRSSGIRRLTWSAAMSACPRPILSPVIG